MSTNLWSWPVVPIALTDTPLFKLLQPTWRSQHFTDGSWTNLALADVENTECGKYLSLISELQEISRTDWTQGPDPLQVTDLINALNCSNESGSDNQRYPAVTALWVVILRFKTLDFILSRWKPRLEAPIMPAERPPLPSFTAKLEKLFHGLETWDTHVNKFLEHRLGPSRVASNLEAVAAGLRWVREPRGTTIWSIDCFKNVSSDFQTDGQTATILRTLQPLSQYLMAPLLIFGNRKMDVPAATILQEIKTHAFLGVYRPNGSALQYAEIAATEALCATCTGRPMTEVVETLSQTMQRMPEVQASDRVLFKRDTSWPWQPPYKGSMDIQRTFKSGLKPLACFEVIDITSCACKSACRHIETLDQAGLEQEHAISLSLDSIASEAVVSQWSQVKPSEPIVPLPDPSEKRYCYCNQGAGTGEVRGFGSSVDQAFISGK
ncbi:hypothetical protein K438DRAFT_2012526 [Mycena galopus ATCC 62051]|nr:hypothetical protein K438DRAFT_2012526 [Mycena galopus ATCC 62051]